MKETWRIRLWRQTIVLLEVQSPIYLDNSIDPKYQDLADKLELWHGLTRAAVMLPIGAPAKSAPITSRYGDREHPLDGVVKPHTGIDFGGKIGTPLYAVAPGKVIFAGDKKWIRKSGRN